MTITASKSGLLGDFMRFYVNAYLRFPKDAAPCAEPNNRNIMASFVTGLIVGVVAGFIIAALLGSNDNDGNGN